MDVKPTTLPPPAEQHLNLPNLLTGSRLVLAVVLFILIAWELWVACVVVFAAAAVTDWLDGFFARMQGISSSLGRNLDPLVDKVLICGAYIFLQPVAGAGLLPWMVTVVVARELIITSLRSFLENRGAKFGADWLGKIKMVLQCAALFAIFVALQVNGGPSAWWVVPTQHALIWGMLASTALSGLQYLWRAASLLQAENT